MLKLLILFCFGSVFCSCQKEYSNSGNTFVFDPDALLFLHTASITDQPQMLAVNNLVIQLKQDSLWNKFLAIYPMVGGTAQTTKWNLKDPRDLDAAYRITWYGTPDFETSGVTCTKETDWGNTHLADSALSFNNSAISFYSGTENKTAGYDMGCGNHAIPYNIMAIYNDYSNDVVNTWFFQYDTTQKLPTSTVGLFINSSKNGRVVFYDNGVALSGLGTPTDAYSNISITIGKITDDPNMGLKKCQLATIGQGLTAADASGFYKIAHTFQTALGR